MGRDTDTDSQAFNTEADADRSGEARGEAASEAEVKSASHNFSSLSGSASNICWVNIKVGVNFKKIKIQLIKI